MTGEPPADRVGCDRPHVVLAAGSTATARIDGISAAGADASLLPHTPAADAELLAYGDVAAAPAIPVSPTGCPTPALVTRAAREVLCFDATIVDAGLAAPTAAPNVNVGAALGDDVRHGTAVRTAGAIVEYAREWAKELPFEHLAVAETIPGGTTTALGLLRALGEREAVSSSLPENPLARKREVVDDGLAANDLEPGDCAGRPIEAIRAVGDPMQATVLGIVEGALGSETDLELWGGTQMLAIVAALRHRGADATDGPAASDATLRVATTSYVADDESAAVRELAADLDVDLRVTDPGFDDAEHDALRRFAAGEAKEGVGMGGALGLAARRNELDAVCERFAELYDARVASDGVVAAPNDAASDATDRDSSPSSGGTSDGP